MIVCLSAEAEKDLEAIGDFIARDSPKRAISFTLLNTVSPRLYVLVELLKLLGVDPPTR